MEQGRLCRHDVDFVVRHVSAFTGIREFLALHSLSETPFANSVESPLPRRGTSHFATPKAGARHSIQRMNSELMERACVITAVTPAHAAAEGVHQPPSDSSGQPHQDAGGDKSRPRSGPPACTESGGPISAPPRPAACPPPRSPATAGPAEPRMNPNDDHRRFDPDRHRLRDPHVSSPRARPAPIQRDHGLRSRCRLSQWRRLRRP